MESSTLQKLFSFAIVLTTGIGPTFTLTVIVSATIPQICVNWPSPMTNVRELHLLWLDKPQLKITEHHARLLGFEESLWARRKNLDESVCSIGNIHLRFSVKTVIKKHPLRSGNGVEVVYVELTPAVDDFSAAYRKRKFTDVALSTNISGAESSNNTATSWSTSQFHFSDVKMCHQLFKFLRKNEISVVLSFCYDLIYYKKVSNYAINVVNTWSEV